jgi:DNA repair exonuclease SbcCD nuclease subunit
MTLSFVTDIHLNLRKNSEWEKSRFLKLFDILAQDDSSLVVLGGDIFDVPKPTLEELSTFYEGIEKLKEKQVIVISGNHENLSEHKTVFDYIPKVGFTYIEQELRTIGGVDCYFVSHIRCKEIYKSTKAMIRDDRESILFSHFRANYGTFIKGEIDVKEVSDIFTKCFVGDIHHKYSPYSNTFYPSSPYGIHFELLRDYGYYSIKLEDGKTSFDWVRLNLPSKVLIETTTRGLESTLILDPDHLYKVVVKGIPDTKTSSILMKMNNVAQFDYKTEQEENTEEFEELIDELSSHKQEEISQTLLMLLKANEFNVTKELEEYLQGILIDVKN